MNEKIERPIPAIPRRVLCPAACRGVEAPVVCLDGPWEICPEGMGDWRPVSVPSDMSAVGGPEFAGRYRYRRRLDLPEGAARYVIKFEAVNGSAEVFVDGVSAARHQNGFVGWFVDATALCAGKRTVELAVTVDEKADTVCAFNHGGILRSVWLYCLPARYFDGLYITTRLGAENTAKVRIDYAVFSPAPGDEVLLSLFAPDGTQAAERRCPCAPGSNGYATETFTLETPELWDAEHPRRYTLRLTLLGEGTVLEQTEQAFGVRQIDRVQNRLYVNKQEVKLRGACRHEITPANGRAVTRAWIDEDIRLFKKANCNYIRTSHYPPSEYFLDQCDRWGLYVEDELDLAFIAKTGPYYQRDPACTARFQSVFAEVLARDFNHPSVLFWSIANEAYGGCNYDCINQFAHQADPTRPTKFSYPMTIRPEAEPVDIFSIHYANWDSELDKKRDNLSVGGVEGHDMPILYDEYVHVPCYNRTELRRDPYVRVFWGESLRRFYERIWRTPGALGGAIWAGIDETNLFTPGYRLTPAALRGGDRCLEWGIMDIWRREKPELTMTRKAYTPVPVREAHFALREGMAAVTVENRFCHTNLAELLVNWQYGTAGGTVRGPEVSPYAGCGTLLVPVGARQGDEALTLQIFDPNGLQVDEYRLTPQTTEPLALPRQADFPPLNLRESGERIAVSGADFTYELSKATGLLCRAARGTETLLTGGPVLHLPYLPLGPWRLFGCTAVRQGQNVVVTTCGGYTGTLDVTFTLTIRPDATLETDYKIDALYVPLPPEKKLRVGVDAGGLNELGVAYRAAPGMDRLSWRRQGGPAVYPADHIARLQGTAQREGASTPFGVPPALPWKDETKEYILNGPYDVDYKGTADFRSLKENVCRAALYSHAGQSAIGVLGEGTRHLRVQVEEPRECLIFPGDAAVERGGAWYPVEDEHCLGGKRWLSRQKGAWMQCRFAGTGIVWYGPVDTTYGIARVFVDGACRDEGIDQKVAGVDFPGSAAGDDRKYRYPVYSVTGLPAGAHTLRIEVTGEKIPDAGDCYIAVDCFRLLDDTKPRPEPVSLLLLNDFNYPQISWGNWKKEGLCLAEGYQNRVVLCLEKRPDKTEYTDEY